VVAKGDKTGDPRLPQKSPGSGIKINLKRPVECKRSNPHVRFKDQH
jgi:hypothetical protein